MDRRAAWAQAARERREAANEIASYIVQPPPPPANGGGYGRNNIGDNDNNNNNNNNNSNNSRNVNRRPQQQQHGQLPTVDKQSRWKEMRQTRQAYKEDARAKVSVQEEEEEEGDAQQSYPSQQQQQQQTAAQRHAQRLARFNSGSGQKVDNQKVRAREDDKEEDGEKGAKETLFAKKDVKRAFNNGDDNDKMVPPTGRSGTLEQWKDVHGFTTDELKEIDRMVRSQRCKPIGNVAERISYVIKTFRDEQNFSSRAMAEHFYKIGIKSIWFTWNGFSAGTFYGSEADYVKACACQSVGQAIARLQDTDFPTPPLEGPPQGQRKRKQ